jgi:hypothetical protein
MYICDNWYVLYVLVDCRRAWMEWNTPSSAADSRLRITIHTNCHIYTLLPPDDGLLASPKHVELWLIDKLKINSTSSWFHYTHISRCTVNKKKVD